MALPKEIKSTVVEPIWHEFDSRWDGMRHALRGGLWLHRFTLNDEPMAHLISVDRDLLLRVGEILGMEERWLQYKPLKDLATGRRVDAWHWDLLRDRLELAVELAGERIPLREGRR